MPVVVRKVMSGEVDGLPTDMFVKEDRPVNDNPSNDDHDTDGSDSDSPSSQDTDGDDDNDNGRGDDNGNDPDGDNGNDDGTRTFTQTISSSFSGTGTGVPTVTTITETTHRSHSSTFFSGATSTPSSSSTSSSTSKSGSGALNLTSSSKHLSGGSIGGIVFASVLGAIVLGGLFIYFCRRRNRSRNGSQLDLLGTSSPGMTQINQRGSRPNLFAPDTRPNSPTEHLPANLPPRGGDDHSEGHESLNTQDSHNMAGVGAGVINLTEAMGIPRTVTDVGGRNGSINRYGYYGSTNSRVPVLSPAPLPARSSMMSTGGTKFPLPLVAGGSGRSTPQHNTKRLSLSVINDSDEGSGRSSFVETDAGPVVMEVSEVQPKKTNPPPPY